MKEILRVQSFLSLLLPTCCEVSSVISPGNSQHYLLSHYTATMIGTSKGGRRREKYFSNKTQLCWTRIMRQTRLRWGQEMDRFLDYNPRHATHKSEPSLKKSEPFFLVFKKWFVCFFVFHSESVCLCRSICT